MTDQPFAGLLSEYDAHHALVGRKVSVVATPNEPPVSGKCVGLDSIGRLLLRSRAKTHAVIAGHVSLVD
jgi:biotin-(acetyl-CoA carboxylase) ligase